MCGPKIVPPLPCSKNSPWKTESRRKQCPHDAPIQGHVDICWHIILIYVSFTSSKILKHFQTSPTMNIKIHEKSSNIPVNYISNNQQKSPGLKNICTAWGARRALGSPAARCCFCSPRSWAFWTFCEAVGWRISERCRWRSWWSWWSRFLCMKMGYPLVMSK